MDDNVRREVRLLKGYAIVSVVVLCTLSLAAFRSSGRQRFQEIDVERINVVEPTGRPRLVITNTPRSPGLIHHGAAFGDPGIAGKRAGLIFFNDDGTESGGLSINGHRGKDGVVAHGGLSFDRYEQEDVVMLDYDESRGFHSQGLKIADRSNTPLKEILETLAPIERMPEGNDRTLALQRWTARYGDHAGGAIRVFVGRDTAARAALDLKDRAGRTRLRLSVDSSGVARIDFLDAGGRVEQSIGVIKPR